MDFTIEEINLCKQVAERYGKKVGWGDWGLVDDQIHLYDVITIEKDTVEKGIIPLWTLSDCLGFLREKIGIWYELKGYRQGPPYGKLMDFFYTAFEIKTQGKTPLEACLKAVLAVLEEGK